MIAVVDPTTSESVAVTSTPALFDMVLDGADSLHELPSYEVVCDVHAFVAQGDDSVVASAGDGSILVVPGHARYLNARSGTRVSIVRDSTDGRAALTPVRR